MQAAAVAVGMQFSPEAHWQALQLLSLLPGVLWSLLQLISASSHPDIDCQPYMCMSLGIQQDWLD